MVHYQNDYLFGTEKQKDVLPKIQTYFKRNIKENPEQYAKFDFEDDNFNYELKSRKNTLNKYPDTMITLNKCIAGDKGLILLFNFTDTLAYIEYNKEIFDTFRTQNFSRANQQWDMKEHIFIPINLLTII